MIRTFSLKSLAVAITSLSVASVANAAALDRSGQDITAFLQDGLYAEASYTYIDADVTGYDNAELGIADLNKYNQGNKISDIAESYDMARYGVKADVNDVISVGILYDEPFGAAAEYTGNNNFVSPNAATGAAILQGAKTAVGQAMQSGDLPTIKKAIGGLAIAGGLVESAGEATKVEVRTENITGLVGVKLGDNFQVYGGPAIQRLRGDVALRGPAYLTSAGYDAHISPSEGYGWVAGAAFSKPEIALKAALTYRSEIDHENNIDEVMPSVGYLPENYQAAIAANAQKNGQGRIDITTPESFNFDFQTGINPTTLATAKVRYVPWSDFSLIPPVYNASSKVSYPEGLPLVSYDKDQWQVELGLAKRLTPALAVSGAIGWDSGAGNPVTSLGPIEGYYSVGAGAKFNIDKNWAISAGGKYLMFGDAKGMIPNKKVVSNFEDNDGYALGVKLSYQDK